MTEQTRRWSQIHLSTAIVLMFSASGLLWANFFASTDKLTETGVQISGKRVGVSEIRRFGWPYCVLTQFINSEQGTVNDAYSDNGSFVWNIGITLSVLFLVAFFTELALRTERHGQLVVLLAMLALGVLIFKPASRPVPTFKLVDYPAVMIKKHANFIREAIASLDKGDVEDAKLSFDLAKSFGLSDVPECKALEDEYAAKIKKRAGR